MTSRGLAALALCGTFVFACSASTGEGAGTGGAAPAATGGNSPAGSGGAVTPGSGGSNVTGSGGTIASSGGTTGTTGSGGATTSAGGAGPTGSGGAKVGTGGSGPAQSCADPTPKGTLDVAGVGTAPSGLTEADLKDGSTQVVHYYMSLPGGLPPAGTTDPAKQVGLIMVFNEHSSNPKTEMPSVTKALANLKRSGDYVVIGMPQEVAGSGYTTGDTDRATKLLAYAMKTWPINPRRVHIWGLGSGATFAHTFGTNNKGTFASMVTYSWGMERWPSNAANDQPDLYLVIGLDDYPDSHVPLVRRVYQAAKKQGFNIIYREVPGLKGPSAPAITNDDAVNWLINTRHKTIALSAPEDTVLAPYRDTVTAQKICPDGAAFASIGIVGGTQAGKVMPAILGAGAEASRTLAAQLTGRVNFGTDADTALAGLVHDASATVRKAAIAALGQTANWRNQAAQAALIALAKDTAADAVDRGLAVDAIGVAVKYQIGGAVDTGGYQDPPLFMALVGLLSDSDATLRAKAFAILKPAMNSTYDATANPSTQTTAISAWQTWVMSLKG